MSRPAAQRFGTSARAHRWAFAAVLAIALGVAAPSVPTARAAAAAAAPVTTEPVDNEKTAIRYGGATDAVARRVGVPAPSPISSPLGDLWKVTAALAFVLMLVLLLRSVARRMSLVPPGAKANRSVRLLGRTVLAPKQQVLLLQVGRRVVVVGDSGPAGMRPLCEITDPDEVAALVGDARAEATAGTPHARSFANMFRRASEPFETGDEPSSTAGFDGGPPQDLPGDVSGLLDKVRGIKSQFDR